jgi:hypothetical protein
MRRRIRAVDGPLYGAVWPFEGKLRLGRASDCDVQIVHEGVSRHHAQLLEEDGHVALVDLSSNNGTFVNERRIVRHGLRVGEEFRIMISRFVFEEIEDDEGERAAEQSGVWAVKVTGLETMRRTVDQWAQEQALRETPPDGIVAPGAPAARAAPVGQDRHRIVATLPDGGAYDGDLVGDILEFRALRLRSLRGEPMAESVVHRFEQLQRRLGPRTDDPNPWAKVRKFHRFRCNFPARLRYGSQHGDRTVPVLVADLGAGGVCVTWPDHGRVVGELAWLVIDLVAAGRPRTIVLTARVANAERGHCGLLFAGAPEWDRAASAPDDTNPGTG